MILYHLIFSFLLHFKTVNHGKIELRSIIDTLNATKPKLEMLIMDLVLLKSKTLELKSKNVLPHDYFVAFIDSIASYKQKATHEQVHLEDMRGIFNCKFMRVCYEDDLKTARNTLLQKITKIGDVEKHCTGELTKILIHLVIHLIKIFDQNTKVHNFSLAARHLQRQLTKGESRQNTPIW